VAPNDPVRSFLN